jgi:hypothetical protein
MAVSRINNNVALSMCNAVVDALDAGAGAGYVQIRTGAAPTNCEDANSGTLLATLTCSDPAFGAAVDLAPGARATASAITGDTSADATGTAAHFRAFDSNNVCVLQGDVTATGGGGAMELNSVSINTGVAVDITSWTVTVPET